MSSINHRDIRAAFCSTLPATQYHQVALIDRGWWETLQQDKGYREAQGLSNIYRAARAGRRDVVELLIKRGDTNWNGGLFGAALGSHVVTSERQRVSKRYDDGMNGAACGGHRGLVEYFIERGASDWNRGMAGAAWKGHKELVELFIKQGASNFDGGMFWAAWGGHKELVDFFIERGAHNWALGMIGANKGCVLATGEHRRACEELKAFFQTKCYY